MSGPDRTRLRKELEKLTDWDISGVDASPVGDDLTHLSGRIRGPKDTPYEGGIFGVDILIPRDYPFAPPKMKCVRALNWPLLNGGGGHGGVAVLASEATFTTSLWHPNVSSQTGAICLDILKVGTGSAWSPALTIKTALLSLQALLSAPEPNDPQDAQVASQYKKDYKQWCATAKYWTEIHAMGPTAAAQARAAGGAASGAGATSSAAAAAPKEPPITDPKLKTLIEMGFDRKKAEAALGAKKGNVEAALEYLFATA